MIKKTNVLYLLTAFGRGGVESYVINTLRHIDKERYNVTIVAHNQKDDHNKEALEELGIQFIHLPLPTRIGLISYAERSARIIRKNNIDIVHIQTFYGFLFAAVSRHLHIKTIVHSHGTKINYSEKGFYQKVISYVMRIMLRVNASSRLAAGVDAGRFLFGRSNFTVIENGIELHRFAFDNRIRNRLRKDFSIAHKDRVLMCVGRMAYPKNQVFAVDVFAEYSKINPNSCLMLVGDGDDREIICRRVMEHGIEGKVIFTGMRDDVNRLLNLADLLIMPSISEGFPVVLIESQANGLKILASDAIDITTRLTDNMVYYSLQESAKSWAEKIEAMDLARNTTSYLKMKDSAYNIEKSVKKLEKIYEDLTCGR